MRKVFFLLGMIYLLEIVSACQDCGDDNLSGFYKLQAITVNHIDFTGTQHAMTTASEVSKSEYGLLATFEIEYLHTAQSRERTFSLISSAFACDPATDYHGVDTVTSVSVFSLQDFNAENLAGRRCRISLSSCVWDK